MAGNTIQLAWGGEYGPDGPWQAIRVLTPALGGNYTATNSSSAVVLTNETSTYPNYEPLGPLIRRTWEGNLAVDLVMLDDVVQYFDVPVNASLDVVEKWDYSFTDADRFFSAPVGRLGLGTVGSAIKPVWQDIKDSPPAILPQLKSKNSIASTSFGLHIGSVALGQPASLVLGGYEQNRVLGSVAIFKFDSISSFPLLYLLDVLLGTQVGASPFANPDKDEGSVWQGISGNPNENAEEVTERHGLRPGTAVVTPDATVPYIYLPPGTCEAAASRLPVRWNDRLGLYLWNTEDPAYQRIVRSPAYLSFVFADRTATNVTIKVPFRLLDLTLEPPLMPTPTPYFPCKPVNTTGVWVLGRAFLQAAFFGVNFEQNVMFLAQAPGPAAVQRVVRSLGPGDTTLQTDPIEEFEKSWLSSWTVLSSTSSGGNGGLSTGSVVGIVVGIIAALVMSVIAGWFFWKRKAIQKQAESLPSGAEVNPEWATSIKEQSEMDGQGNVAELGKPYDHELYTPPVVHELPIDNWNLPECQGRTR